MNKKSRAKAALFEGSAVAGQGSPQQWGGCDLDVQTVQCSVEGDLVRCAGMLAVCEGVGHNDHNQINTTPQGCSGCQPALPKIHKPGAVLELSGGCLDRSCSLADR